MKFIKDKHIMYPFGVFLTLYILLIIISNNTHEVKYIKLVSLCVCLELFVNVGYLFKLNDYEFTYSEFALLIVVIYAFLILIKSSLTKKIIFSAYILFLSILITGILLSIYPLSEPILRNDVYTIPRMSVYSLLISLRVLIIIITLLSLKSILNNDYINIIVSYITKFAIFIIFICVFEWITKNIFKSSVFIELVETMFGKGGSTVDFILVRANLSTMQGFTREPSGLSNGLFYFIVMVTLFNTNSKSVTKLILCVVALLILSGSFTSILYILCLSIIYLITNKSKKLVISLFACSIALIIFFTVKNDLFQYYYMRIVNSLDFVSTENSNLLVTSEGYRINSVIQTLRILPKRPLFGIGLGMPYSYGFLSSILASVGVIGYLLWFNFMFKAIGRVKFNKKTCIAILSITSVWIFSGSSAIMYSVYTGLIAISIGYAFNGYKTKSLKE